MSRLSMFNLKFDDLNKYNIKIDETTGLELPTEYNRLCRIRDASNSGKLHYCKNCEHLQFEFNQKTYMINYFCEKNKEKVFSIEDIEKVIVCETFSEIKK